MNDRFSKIIPSWLNEDIESDIIKKLLETGNYEIACKYISNVYKRALHIHHIMAYAVANPSFGQDVRTAIRQNLLSRLLKENKGADVIHWRG